MYGQGLHSIRNRFTLLMGGFVALTVLSVVVIDRQLELANWTFSNIVAGFVAMIVIPMAVTYILTGHLTDTIDILRRATEALAKGDLNAHVDVDCPCEIGGLADSFRSMVARLNANLLRINVLAYTDPVTRLPNRAVLRHILEFGLAPERGADRLTGSLLFIDLDKFKHVNDSLGHEAGDELLCAAAARIIEEGFCASRDRIDHCTTAFGELCELVPRKLVFVRFAGDEFVALLPGVTDPAALARIGERVVQALDRPFAIKGSEVRIGASIGIATLHRHSSCPQEVMSCADLAMYAAKKAGRGRIAFYDARMGEMAAERTRLEVELRHAIGAGQLRIVYQPKIDVDTLSVISVEALVRWQHPERGWLDPGAFIGIAEQTGLIDQLGEEVLRLVARQCREWLAAGIRHRISVNVSHTQFLRADFAERTLASIAEEGMPTDLLEIEVTEAIAMVNPELALRHLQVLRAVGVSIAIDDFGVGYSNLSQLAALPFDALKIDRSLVAGIGEDPKREQIIVAILGMAAAMRHEVVAEGVETLAQFEFLAEHRCTHIQGFLLARPMSAETIPHWRREALPRRAGTAPIPANDRKVA